MSLLFGTAHRDIDPSDIPWGRGGDASVFGSGMAEKALRLIPVYSAIAGIADDLATAPLHAYRRTGDRRTLLDPAPALVASPGGPGISRITWVGQCVASLLTDGNAFGYVAAIGPNGWPSAIRWLRPDLVSIDESKWARPEYVYNGNPLPAESVVHIPAFALPGSVRGLSPLTLFRLQITKGLKAEEYASDFFERGIMPPGVLRNKAKTLNPGESNEAKRRFKAAVAGRDIFVTGNDWDWTTLQIPQDDATFLHSIKATATQVAAIYRVAPEDIGGETGNSMTYSTVELNELKRNRRALLPWAVRVENALTENMPHPQFAKFNLDALVRVDLLTRMRAHDLALRSGVETNAEARAFEDRSPLTPAEREAWKNDYGRSAPAPVATPEDTPK